MLDHQLRLSTPTPMAQAMPIATPTPSRRPPASSPDPLAIRSEGPSPSKKARTSNNASPSKRVLEIVPPSLTDAQKAQYTSFTSSNVSGQQRSTASMRSTPATKDEESEDDDIDWGQSKADIEGDWQMGQDASEPAYSQSVQRPLAAGRTGDTDQRCEYECPLATLALC